MGDLTSAYETAMNAEGSALRENATYMDSIQGRIKQFNNAVQTMWMNFISSDVVKFIVNVGTELTNLIDKVGLLNTAISTILAVKMFKGKSGLLEPLNEKMTNIINKLLGNNIAGADSAGAAGESIIPDSVRENIENNLNDVVEKASEKLVDLGSAEKAAGDAAEQAAEQAEGFGSAQGTVGNAARDASSGVDTLRSAQTAQAAGADRAKTANKGTAASEIEVGNAAQAASLKVRLLTSALTFGLSLGIGYAIQWIAKLIDSLHTSEKEAAEAARNAVKDSQNLTKEFKSLEEYKDQIRKLRESLDSNNLSQAEAYDARQKLLTIQDELISKFGLEKEGINLVTGAIEEQIDVIDEYDKKNARKWLNNNQKSINEAIEFFDSGIIDNSHTITNWAPTENVKKMVEAYASDQKYIFTSSGRTYQKVRFMGPVEKVKSEFEAFQEWLRIKEKEMRDELNELISLPLDKQTTDVSSRIASLRADIDQLQDYREDLSEEHENWFGEDSKYATNKALMDETKQETALANYSDQYMKILKAQNDFKEAQAKGDEEGMKEALDALHSATSEAMDDAGEWYMDEFFGELDKEFAAEEFELNVKTDEDGLKTQIQGIIKDSGLSALDNNQIKDMINRGLDVEGAVDESGAYTEEQISGLVELKTTADNAGISIETLISILTNLGLIKGRPAEAINSIESTGKAYSMLASEAEKYNSINETLNESVYDGIKISKDQYEALSELIGAEKEFADCIDTTDGYVIKDIALTKKLVAEKKKELAIETRAAKSRAELQYYDLVDSLGEAIDATGEFSEANETSAASILDEISAVKLAINQYQMLEDSLLGVTSAFDDFANSQEIDSKNTYGSTYVEMAQTMYDAIYKTGEVGTEAFWAAVRANVPSDIYAGLAPGKEQIQAIAKYLNENVFSTLTLSDESFSIDYSDIEDFVEKAQDAGVFTGIDASSFGLSADFLNSLDDGEDALQAFADKLGMTKTQVYAMLSEMDKYNADGIGFSMLFQLDNSAEGNIAVLTSELEKLYIERQKLIKQGADEDILSANSQDILEVKSQLDEVKQQSVEIVMDYAEVDNAIAHTDAKLQDVMSEDLISKLGLNGDITVGEQLEKIQDAMLLLEEPVVMDLETAKKEIEDLEKLNPTIEAHVELGENGKYEIINSDDFMANGGNIEDLEYYVELKNAESFINTSLEDGLTTTETLLSKINENVAIIAGEEPKSNESEGNESSTGFGGAQRSGGGGQAHAGAGGGRLSDYGIDDFRQAIAAKMFDAGFAGNKTAVDALGNLYNQLDYIEQGFNNGESKENVQAQLRELQAEAEKYGVNIPVTLQISTEQVELPAAVDTSMEKTEMPVVFDIPRELSDAYADGTEATINLKTKTDTESAESAGEKVAEIAQGAASSMPVIVESETGLSNPNDFKTTPVKSYSQLQGDVESFNSILSENEEIIGNNIEVTQEYKESLAELLGIEVKELDKYFDGNNKLLVKNADGLKKLTKEAKNNTKQNIKLAKSQAQLEYVELVNQLDDMLNVTDDLTDKNIDAANSLLSQIDSVQRTILKYQMLEESLLGAADAFKKFESAKEIDSQNTYGDSYIEMAQTIYDAYYKTGEVGSEAVRSAVEALIDPSVYAGLERGSEEYNQAIYDAFNKTVLPTLTLNEDTLSIDYESVEQFVTNGLGKIFTGTGIKDFDLIDGLNFEDAAKSMGMTTTQLYAMLAALKQFTGRDYLHEFVDGSISGGIMDITSKIEELNREKLELMNDGVTEEEQKRIDEINVALAQNKQELQELGAQAYNTWQEYTKVDGALNVLDEVQDKGQKVSEVFPKDFVTDLGLTGEETVQEAYDALLKKQLELEQPTKLTMTYAIDNIDDQIKELETALETGDYTNIGPISFDLKFGKTPEEQIKERIDALKDDKAAIAVAFNIELSEEEREDLEKQLESIEQFKINDKVFTVTGNTSATMLKLRALKLLLDKIKDKEIKIKTNYSTSGTPNNGRTRVNGTAHVDGTAFKTGSWGALRTETALVGELGPELVNL